MKRNASKHLGKWKGFGVYQLLHLNGRIIRRSDDLEALKRLRVKLLARGIDCKIVASVASAWR